MLTKKRAKSQSSSTRPWTPFVGTERVNAESRRSKQHDMMTDLREICKRQNTVLQPRRSLVLHSHDMLWSEGMIFWVVSGFNIF